MLVVLGVSHRQVPLATLERLAAAPDELAARLTELATSPQSPIGGAVLLATCHRLEIYLDASRFHDALESVTGLLADDLAEAMTVQVGAGVAAHLSAVASGLESVVVGESEIAGQVARALENAPRATPELHRLFQLALNTARTVAARTRIGAEGRSVAGVALDAANDSLGGMAGKSALVIGTGAFARVVTAALRARGVDQLSVYSPSGRADAFARTHRARPVSAPDLLRTLAAVDLVVSASGRGPVLTVQLVQDARAGAERELVLVDLALPHDIPAQVRALPAVQVIDLETVVGAQAAASSADDERWNTEQRAAREIVAQAVERFERTSAERIVDPAVVALRRHVLSAADGELDRLRRKYSDEIAADLERSLHRVTHAVLHSPTMRAKQLARDGSVEDYLDALHTVFGIDLRP